MFLNSIPNIEGVSADNQQLERAIALSTGGAFRYSCRPHSGTSFGNGDTLREGVLFIVPTVLEGKCRLEVFGCRTRSVSSAGQPESLERFLWSGIGEATTDSGELKFYYEITGAEDRGHSRDDFRFAANDLPKTWGGSFEHIERDGMKVEGKLSLERIKDQSAGIPLDLYFSDFVPAEKWAAWCNFLADCLVSEETRKEHADSEWLLIDAISRETRFGKGWDDIDLGEEMSRRFPSSMVLSIRLSGEKIVLR